MILIKGTDFIITQGDHPISWIVVPNFLACICPILLVLCIHLRNYYKTKNNGLSGAEEDSASPRPVSLTSEIFKSFLDLNRTSR